MKMFQIERNDYLSTSTTAFFHTAYTRMGNPGNPDYLNDLKNTFNDFSEQRLQAAVRQLRDVLDSDLPKVLRELGCQKLTVCVVPRAKAESAYRPNQQLFLSTVMAAVKQIDGLVDGCEYIRRHTNTKTTHLRNPVPNYKNNGKPPYPGITRETCDISKSVIGRDILLVDDIYTPGVNIDEDAISALLDVGARQVSFYAVAKVLR